MTLTREQFYMHYDEMMPRCCEPYSNFLSIAAKAIPKDAKSIFDLGIGTGNFSLAVQKRIPNIRIYGIDMDQRAIEVAKTKLKNAKIYCGNFFSEPFPQVDYFISSLATHHFNTQTRNQKLTQIVTSAKGFINFDMVLRNGDTREDAIVLISNFAKKYFNKRELEEIIKEIQLNDNPMQLNEQERLFNSLCLEFNILAEQPPYVVYSVFRPQKNK